MERRSHDIAEVRSRICDSFLVVGLVASIPALTSSLYRITVTGWLPIMAAQVALFFTLCFFVFFRRRVPYVVRAGFIIVAFLALGLGGMWEVGLVGSAIVFLVVAPALSAIFFGALVGAGVLLCTICSTGLIGAYTVVEHRVPLIDPSFYAMQATSWTTMLVALTLVASTMLAALIMYNKGLYAALRVAGRTEDELTRRIEERVSDLNMEIDERRKAESELRRAEAALIEANSNLEERVAARTRELQAEKERFRNIVENTPVELSLKDLDDSYVVINPVARVYYEEAARKPLEEGATAAEFWPRELAETFARHDREVMQAGQALTFEDVLPAGDGARVVKTTKFPVTDADGVVTGIGTVGIDVTREREAELKLRESEERFRSLAEHSPNAIALKDADGRYLLVNERFENLLGVRRADVIGKMVDQVFEGEFAASGVRHDREVIERKQAVATEEQFTAGGRTLRFATTKFPILDGNGEIAAIAAVHTDLTERIEATEALARRESEYRQLVELNPDAVIVQCDGRIVLVNESACKMFGASSAEEMIGREALSIVHPEVRDRILRHREQVLADQVAVPPMETRHLRLDGTWFHSEFTAGPVTWEGRPATINLIRDVTERRRIEAQLQQAQKMEMVGQLTGGLAHDFNNLLGIIMGNADFLRDAVRPDHQGQVEAVIRAAQRGADLTHRLLAFSRQQVLEPRIVNANDILADMIELLRRTLGQNIAVTTKTDKDLWHCEVDLAQFENALLNLAVNARDAMPDGGTLTVETTNARLGERVSGEMGVTPGDYVLVSVSDTGSGMTPEVRSQVFEPFFTTKKPGKGTGLGLSMVYGFVKQSGGHIEIDSDVGAGTTVRLYLPRRLDEKAAPESRPQPAGPVTGKGEVILVVEDDADLRAMVIQMLESLGYAVLDCGTGSDALEILDGNPSVRLLLTDVILAGDLGGRALADRARAKYPDLPVLYMSGYTGEAVVHRGRLENGAQLLEKPFRKPDIARAVRKALEGV